MQQNYNDENKVNKCSSPDKNNIVKEVNVLKTVHSVNNKFNQRKNPLLTVNEPVFDKGFI